MKKILLLLISIAIISFTYGQKKQSKTDHIIATLKYLTGKTIVNKNLKKNKALYTPEFEKKLIAAYGKDIRWFFSAYCKQDLLPNIIVNYKNDTLYLNWSVPSKLAFEMPVELSVAEKNQTVLMPKGKAKIYLTDTTNLAIDPLNKILKKSEWKEKLSLRNKLKNIKGLTYWEIAARDHFTQAYHITLEQAINHNNKESKTFKQQMYLSHVNENKPFLMETCGYEAYDNTKEIAKMTQGNQLVIEYRFYGKSKPERADYTYLRNIQAAKDYHHINTEFKKIYTGKWISSGVSKGGANAITYRYLYPEDVNVTIPYVAPITLKREDERTTKHINTIGEESCREKTFQFQKTLLKRRDEILPMLKSYSGKYEKSYSIGFDTALEYAAYEYTFSFWQWLGDCDKIPDKNASASELFNHVENTVGWSFYADETIKKLHPCYYQHMVELGYYGFQTKHIANLVKVVKQPDNMFFAPKNQDYPKYDNSLMKKVWEFATNKANNFIYIYGEYDTWTSCGITPSEHLNAIKMVKKGGTHRVRIKHFNEKEKTLVYDTLSKWLNVNITPLD